MSLSGILGRVYSSCMNQLLGRFRPEGSGLEHHWVDLSEFSQGESYLWFHGASAGELESLFPVVSRALQSGASCVVTVFSPSGRSSLLRFADRHSGTGGESQVKLRVGFCPNEGSWERVLQNARPRAFITTKYEAWPELWGALSKLEVPGFLICAQARVSLRVLSWFFRGLGWSSSCMRFASSLLDEQQVLQSWFPQATWVTIGDPRWDRVCERATRSHPRVSWIRKWLDSKQESSEHAFQRGAGVGVLGSIWAQDIQVISKGLSSFLTRGGRLVVVPHDISCSSLAEVESVLLGAGIPYSRSSQFSSEFLPSALDRVLLVDEMGFLLELYSLADWAFVGGGFGAGIHSTIEPAYFNIPVACGPRRIESFSETKRLRATQQLTLVANSSEFSSWLESDRQELLRTRLDQWQNSNAFERGAADQAWRWIRSAF